MSDRRQQGALSGAPANRILVVDDEESVAVTVAEILRQDGLEVEIALSGEAALASLQESWYDLVLTDLHMEGADGLSVLAEVRRRAPMTITIVLTGFASLESAIASMRQGAYDYLIKPCIVEDMKHTIQRGLEHRRLMLAEQEARADLERLNRELEQRVADRTSELQRLNEDLAEANRTKDVFFAMLSHELRTPLTPILGWARLLRSRTTNATLLNQGLETIERNAALQTRLIDDLLDISRIMSGKLEFDLEPIDLCSVVVSAIDTVRDQATARGIDLKLELPGSAIIVEGAPVRLQQIVWNLLSNAVKFTESGGRVSVSLDRAGSEARLVVSDTGAGIAPEFLPHVFDLFCQADSSSTRRHGGLGLGLAIVRSLTELHSGWVRAESEGLGHGSRFIVGLPCATGIRLAREDSAQPMQSRPSGPVLIVEDSSDTLELLRAYLTEQGWQVLSADSAKTALTKAASEKPGVIISDIGMPDTNGYELLDEIRRLPGLEKTPVIAISGYATDQDQARALAAGFSAYFTKPIELEKLLRHIQTMIS